MGLDDAACVVRGEIAPGQSEVAEADSGDDGPPVEAPALTAFIELEQLVSAVQETQLQLVERMHTVYLDHLIQDEAQRIAGPPACGARLDAGACDGVAAELEAALGFGAGQARRLVDYATAGWRTRATRAAMASGATGLWRAMDVQERVADLDARAANDVAARALRSRPDGRPPGRGQLLRWIRRARLDVGAPEDIIRERRVRDRDMWASTTPEGVGRVTVDGTEARTRAAFTRVDALARHARHARRNGDQRTLRQLRSDVALDLLLRGRVMAGAADSAPDQTVASTSASTSGSGSTSTSASGSGSGSGSAGAPDLGPLMDWETLGDPPADVVPVTVDLPTLMHAAGLLDSASGDRHPGANEEAEGIGARAGADADTHGTPRHASGGPPGAAELAGHGALTPSALAEIAFSEGTTWARIVTYPLTGDVLEASTPRYAPTPAMRRAVEARDRTCRFPGCDHPAQSCDLDHVRLWHPDSREAATTLANLVAAHRRHHNLKTRGLWRAETVGEGAGTLRWTSLLGAVYVVPAHSLAAQLSEGRLATWLSEGRTLVTRVGVRVAGGPARAHLSRGAAVGPRRVLGRRHRGD